MPFSGAVASIINLWQWSASKLSHGYQCAILSWWQVNRSSSRFFCESQLCKCIPSWQYRIVFQHEALYQLWLLCAGRFCQGTALNWTRVITSVPRFNEHFYPFKVTISRGNQSDLKCVILFEKQQCEHYGRFKQGCQGRQRFVNGLFQLSEHSSMRGNRNYVMPLTKDDDKFCIQNKIRFEMALVTQMDDYEITIKNQTFWRPTKDLCDKYAKNLSSAFPSNFWLIDILLL